MPVGSVKKVDIATVAELLDREISQGEIELPLLPEVATKVLSSSVDERADATLLADLIRQDQGLATHVLRVVNSPGLRGTIEIVSLQQAITRLGMERIREIAVSASVKKTLFKKGAYLHVAQEAWKTALAASLWSKEVARACRKNVEIGYLCGLLHNIGVPVVLNHLDRIAPRLTASELTQLLDDEASRTGEMLVRKWQLPAAVATTIVRLGQLELAGEHTDAVAVAACGVSLAGWMFNEELDVEHAMQIPAVQYLNLYPEDVADILEKQEMVVITIESMSA
ncbi:MAG: HDOD domain-containing protein [Gammaproteobacteria bacterium]|nr:MAG: HDOD domain-containing protein [Gammaproteobacteria bacterium]